MRMWQLEREVGTSPRTTTVALGVAAAVALAAGCDRVGQQIQERVAAEVEARVSLEDAQMPGTLSPPTPTEQDRLADKLALYQECLRRTRGRVVDSHARWVQGIDPETGMPRRNAPRPLVHPVDAELAPCVRATNEGVLSEPRLARIEEAASRYLASAQTYATLANDLDAYYGSEAFKEDAWAKGKLVAPQLESAYVAWDEATTTLVGQLEEIRDGVDELRLAQVGSENAPTMRWHCHRTMLAAKALERCTRQDPLAPGACDGAGTVLEQRATALRAWAEGHRDEAASVFWWPSFDAALTDFTEATTTLLTAPKPKKPDPKLQMQQVAVVRDTADEVRSAFDNLRFDPQR